MVTPIGHVSLRSSFWLFVDYDYGTGCSSKYVLVRSIDYRESETNSTAEFSGMESPSMDMLLQRDSICLRIGAFYLNDGHWEQYIIVIPGWDVIIVRTGDDRDGSDENTENTENNVLIPLALATDLTVDVVVESLSDWFYFGFTVYFCTDKRENYVR